MAGESYSLTPDNAWIVGSALAAAIAAGPAYLASRKSKRAAESTATRVNDAMAYEFGRLHERLDAQDRTLGEVKEWQAEHTTEHAVERLTSRGRLEIRRRDKP